MPLVHHELCFGCGRSNLFGLLIEMEPADEDPHSIAGRCFIKQDHQGPDRGSAHPGLIATALTEAMALACGPGTHPVQLEITLDGAAPIGAFVELLASVTARDGLVVRATSSASCDGVHVASATAAFSS